MKDDELALFYKANKVAILRLLGEWSLSAHSLIKQKCYGTLLDTITLHTLIEVEKLIRPVPRKSTSGQLEGLVPHEKHTDTR
jgi:hypothetical protein